VAKLKVGLYFGSFNPIHNGHLAIANYMLEYSDLQQIWFVVSPQNPFKSKKSLLPDYQRLELVCLALGDSDLYKASNVEFGLPKPSRTVDTLAYLYDKHPDKEFSLIMGTDNLVNFHKWKNHEVILKNHCVYVYPRPDTPETQFDNHPKIIVVDAPLMEISSSFIRAAVKEKRDVRFFVPPKVWDYIKEMNFYC
jgi:nicotinate-nucleotide adenylyltransferase